MSELDQQFKEWFETRILTGPASRDPDIFALGMATMLWVGSGDPAIHGLNQCLVACQYIGAALGLLGYESETMAVRVVASSDARVIAGLGCDSPRFNGSQWTGHAVLWVPSMQLIFDPTVGQGAFATTSERKYPVLLRREVLAVQPPVGSVLGIRRDPGLTLTYNVIEDNRAYVSHPRAASQAAAIQLSLSRVGAEFVAQVREHQNTMRGSSQ